MLITFVFVSVAISSSYAAYAGTTPEGQGTINDVPQTVNQGYYNPVPVFDFTRFYQNYFASLKNFQEQLAKNINSYAYASNVPNGFSNAASSLIYKPQLYAYPAYNRPDKNRIQQAHQTAAAGYPGFQYPVENNLNPNMASSNGAGGFSGSYGSGYGGGYGSGYGNGYGNRYGSGYGGAYGGVSGFGGAFGAPTSFPTFSSNLGNDANGAFSSGSIGSNVVYQSASVYPENPDSPNVNKVIKTESKGPSGNGFYSVFTSSQSGSSNINGKKTGYQEAQTTVNDNGKITTYKVGGKPTDNQ